jgi:hypothetical protein
MPSASLGHYAALSFVVMGREQRERQLAALRPAQDRRADCSGQHNDRGRRSEVRDQKKEERDSPVGAAFPPGRRPYGPEASRDSNDFYDSNLHS